MRKIIFIILITYLAFLSEFILFNVFGFWLKPDLLLLAVVFVNLTWGVRYSLVTAIAAGLWKDSLTINAFGLNIFAFLACAYLTTFIKRYLFHMGYGSLRIFIVIMAILLYDFVLFLLDVLFVDISMNSFLTHVLIPEVILTAIVAEPMFEILRKCVLRLSV